MFRNEISKSNTNLKNVKQKFQSNQLKQAGRNALYSSSNYAKDNLSNCYSSSTGTTIEDTPYVTAKSWCIFDAKTG